MAKKQSSDTAPVPPVAVHPFKRVRRAGVPLSFFETADPAQCILACQRSLNGAGADIPMVQYDISGGLRAVQGSKAGESWLNSAEGQEVLAAVPMGSAMVLQTMANKPPGVGQGDDRIGAVVFIHNCHRIFGDFTSVQATWNCRDSFKSLGTTMILLGCTADIPAELKNDIPRFTEDVPTEEDIRKIVLGICEDQNIDPDSFEMPRVVDGLIGYLTAFNVEQSFCLSLKNKAEGGGVDYQQLWKLKVAGLKALGLEITLPTAGFDTVGGNEGAKQLARYHLNGIEKPRAVLWCDEIEKANAGAQAGNLDGGASMAVTEHFLFWTTEKRVKGFLLVGVPGAGKSLLAKVIAAEAHCPLVRLSLSGVKGGIVGSTETNIRMALASVDAMAQGRVLLVSTCNGVDSLSPEMMGRHTLGTVFFDYPTPEEAKAIWTYYMGIYKLSGEIPRVASNWVGREIESCCERAHLWSIPLADAAATVVPECMSNATKLEALRRSANGRFLSAAHTGFYQVETTQAAPAAGRKLNLA